MGEAQDIVGKPKDTCVKPTPTPPGGPLPKETVLRRLTTVQDDLDRATQVKEKDLANEGTNEAARNHYKLGILHSANSLIRRAHALLEDYGMTLGSDEEVKSDVVKGG